MAGKDNRTGRAPRRKQVGHLYHAQGLGRCGLAGGGFGDVAFGHWAPHSRISRRQAEQYMSVATMVVTQSPPGCAWDSG